MPDLGLLSGIAEGLSAGMDSFWKTKNSLEDRRLKAEQAAKEEQRYQKQQEDQLKQQEIQTQRHEQDVERQYRTGGFKKDEMGNWVPDEDYLRMKAMADPNRGLLQNLNIQQKQQDIAKAKKGEKIPAAQVVNIAEGVAELKTLPDIRETIAQNKEIFGPVTGRLGSLNPYNEKVKTVDAQMRLKAQAIGKFMEGGVLRKEDEDKYRRMLPDVSDTPEMAENKLTLVERMLQNKINEQQKGLKGSGYDTSGIDTYDNIESPKVIRPNKGLIKTQPQAPKSDLPPMIEKGGKKYKLLPDGNYEEL